MLKTHGLLVDPLHLELYGIPSSIQLLAIEVEFLLGCWLISDCRSKWALVATLGFFMIVTCVAAYQVFDRQTSCACFGKFEVSPTYTLALDVIIVISLVGLLFISRNDMEVASHWAELGGYAITTGLLTLILFTIAACVLHNYPHIVSKLRGEVLALSPRVATIGKQVQGTSVTVPIHILNSSDLPIRILGGTASCGCIVHQDLPVTINPQSQVTIHVTVSLKGGYGTFRTRYVLMTDLLDHPVVDGGVTGEIQRTSREAP